jgi:hypothetical protein
LLRYIRVVCDATGDALLTKSFDCLQNTHISRVSERERRRNASSVPDVEYAQRFMAASAYHMMVIVFSAWDRKREGRMRSLKVQVR